MKKFAILFAGLFMMTFTFTSVNAQTEASAVSNAVVLTALDITNVDPLDFGTISGTDIAGTVTIDNAGVRTASPGAAPVGTDGSAAKFTISGPASTTIVVVVTENTMSVEGPGNPMTIALNPGDVATAVGTTSTGGSGSVELKFGGTINVGANQTAGTYATPLGDAAFTVTVSYQ